MPVLVANEFKVSIVKEKKERWKIGETRGNMTLIGRKDILRCHPPGTTVPLDAIPVPSSQFYRTGNCIMLYAIESENKLCFSFVYRSNGKLFPVESYTLSVKTLKSGKTSFNFRHYKKLEGRIQFQIRSVNPFKLKDSLVKIFRNPKKVKVADAVQARINTIINKFLTKHNQNHKYLPKDIYSKMLLLCYPGYEILNQNVWGFLPPYGFAKGDLCKKVLRTNGTYSRKLLVNLLNSVCRAAYIKYILKVVNFFTKKYGLDKTQKLLRSRHLTFNSQAYHSTIINHKTCKYLNKFSHYSSREFANLFFTNRDLSNDTFRLIQILGAEVLEGIEHANIVELHDRLVKIANDTDVIKSKKEKPKYYFSCFLQLQKLCKLAPQVDCDWSVHFPTNVGELQNWSSKMSNCSFAYARDISDERFNIGVIKIKDKITFMFSVAPDKFMELNLMEIKMSCNRRVEEQYLGKLYYLFEESDVKVTSNSGLGLRPPLEEPPPARMVARAALATLLA